MTTLLFTGIRGPSLHSTVGATGSSQCQSDREQNRALVWKRLLKISYIQLCRSIILFAKRILKLKSKTAQMQSLNVALFLSINYVKLSNSERVRWGCLLQTLKL